MPMYNLIEYSDNYSDTSGSLWQFKRDEPPKENNGNISNVSTDNSSSFKYKSNFIGTIPNDGRKKLSNNNCTIKIFKYFLEITRNAIN